MLTLGWSDGVTFLPVNSCLLSSEKESSRINESCDVDANSNGAKARKSATKKATEVIPQLISDAMKAGIRASYVLFCLKRVLDICEHSFQLVEQQKNREPN